MKPIAIFRHAPSEGPGYFATFADRHSLPWRLIRLDAGEPVPDKPEQFSGMCFMGGPMSVNDALPWIPPVLDLIRSAIAADIPVVGHCLGGQLMAKALGGTVTRNPVKEIGWGELEIAGAEARAWLGDMDRFVGFHWHGETFSIPPGATRILGSRYCPNQAFALGPHLGMQCHVEMTEELIRDWCSAWHKEAASPSESVQTPNRITTDLEHRVSALHAVADRLYARWITALKGD